MPISIPFTFVPDTAASADEVNQNFQAIQARFNAGIVDGDIAINAGISGTKLSQVPGSQIPTAALADGAVSFGKLASSGSNDALRAVGTNHIRDLAVTGAKIAAVTIAKGNLILATLTLAQTNALVVTGTYNIGTNGGNFPGNTVNISAWTGGTPTVAGFVPVSWYISTLTSGAEVTGAWNGTGGNYVLSVRSTNALGAVGTITAVFLGRT